MPCLWLCVVYNKISKGDRSVVTLFCLMQLFVAISVESHVIVAVVYNQEYLF